MCDWSNKLRAAFTCALLIHGMTAFSQAGNGLSEMHGTETDRWEEYFNDIVAAENDENTSYDEYYSVLSEMADNPIDINAATREDLERLPFLSDEQIEDICEYVFKHGPVRTMNELAMIKSLDAAKRNFLSFFIRIDDTERSATERTSSLKDLLKRGHHNLTFMANIPFYQRAGDKVGYLGPRYKHWFRYEFTSGDHIQAGITGAQDAGEPFFSRGNDWGYDYYSYYILIKKMGRLEALALGNYRLSVGMGLVLNTSFSLGKTSMITSSGRRSSIIRAHTSRSESDYFRGAAATVRLSNSLALTAFGSYRSMDATLNSDSTASTLITSGYHRTTTEMSKKGNTKLTATGGSLRFDDAGFHCGVTVVYTHINRKLCPDTATTYRKYYASGSDFFNASIDYGYICHRFSAYGEAAVDRRGALATINKLSVRLSDVLTLTALQRFYSYKFNSLYANSFSDGGYVRNESGIYIGANYNPSPRWSLSAYTDYAYFPWAKYRISQASHSWDNLVTVSYNHASWTFSGRYRLRMRERDGTDDSGVLKDYVEHKARLKASYSDEHDRWSCSAQSDFSLVDYEGQSKGYMVSANVNRRFKNARFNASFAYFHTDDYYSRIYTYERGLKYSSYFPSFYGEGIRYTFMATVSLMRNFSLTGKIGVTDYFDRSTISSSYQEIDHSSKVDLELMGTIRF